MNEDMRNLLLTIVADAFDAGAVSDEDHDRALAFLNGEEL